MNKVIIFALICGSFWLWNSYSKSGGDNLIDDLKVSDLPSDSVVLFATKWCAVCKQTREFFEKNDIAYYEYDVEESTIAKSEYNKISNRKGVPLIYYRGEHVLGFSESKIRKLLDKT